MDYTEDTAVTDLASPSKKIKKAVQKAPRSPSERSQGSPTLPKTKKSGQRKQRAQSSELLDKKKRNQKGQQEVPSPLRKSAYSKLIPLQIRRRLGNANLTPEEIEAEVAKLAYHGQKRPFENELQRIRELNALQETSIKNVLSDLGISKPNFMSYLDIYTGLTANPDWIPQRNDNPTANAPVNGANLGPQKPPTGFSTNALLVPPSHFLNAQPYAGFSPNIYRNPQPAPPANTPVPGVHHRLSHQLTVHTQHVAMPHSQFHNQMQVQAPPMPQHIPPHQPYQMDDGMSLTHQFEGMNLEQLSPYPPINPEIITFDDNYEQSTPYSPKSDSMFYVKRKLASQRIEDLSDLFFNEAGGFRGDIAHGDTEEPNDSGKISHNRPLFNLAPIEMDHHSMVDELFNDDFKNFQL